MSDADIEVLRRLAALEGRLGQLYDQVYGTYVPLTTALAEAGGALVGAALNVGTYTVGPVGGGATYSFDYPTTAKAVYARLTVIWASVNAANAAYGLYTGGGICDRSPLVHSWAAGVASDAFGNVTLDANAKFQIVVVNANTTAFYLYILGYYL